MKSWICIFLVLLGCRSSYKGDKNHCSQVTESSMIDFAEDQIKKNILTGDTIICNIIVKWTAKDKSGLTSKIVSDKILNEDLKGINMNLDTQQVFREKSGKTLVLFANNYACLDCFNTVNSFLMKEKLNGSNVRLLVLGRVSNSSSAKRDIINLMKGRASLFNEFIFDIHEENDSGPSVTPPDGLFGKFGIDRTPAVLIWDNKSNQVKYLFKYDQLLSKDGFSVKEDTRKKIAAELLK